MLGKIPVLTHMFHMGWNHQPGFKSRNLDVIFTAQTDRDQFGLKVDEDA